MSPFSIGLNVGSEPPVSRIKMFTRAARLAGFDAVWTVDHFMGFFPRVLWDEELTWVASPNSSPHLQFDYQTLLGHLAAHAGKVRVGVGVTEPIRRHPVLVAQAAMTLAHVAKTAPIIGIGAGERENTEPYGLDFTRIVSRFEEALEIIRLCFESTGPFSYDGEFYQLDDAIMDLRAPSDRKPELWVAAHGPRMLRLAGRFGDGWLPTLAYTPESYAASLETIRSSAREAGRDPDSIVPGWSVFAVIAPTERAARAMLETRLIKFAALLVPAYSWQELGAEHPLGDGFGGLVDFVPTRYERAELIDAIDKVPVDLLAETAMWGTPAVIEARLREFIDVGLRHVVLQPASALVSKKDALYSLRKMVSIQRSLKRWARTAI
jgi:phthiodiolone/phenolphthiodiolone dimycocerosates ketoreductase